MSGLASSVRNCNLEYLRFRAARIAAEPTIDSSQSGTTAITLYIDGSDYYIANIGDSRCMIGKEAHDGSIAVQSLSVDHTPLIPEERMRIESCGARVMSVGQIDGTHGESTENDLPRVWAQEGKWPGCAFSRSIGDDQAKSLGVIAEPEITKHTFGATDRLLIIMSDGVSEFLSDVKCAEIALLYTDPLEACRALVGEAYKLWIEKEDRCDDITIILGFIEPPKKKPLKVDAMSSVQKQDAGEEKPLEVDAVLCTQKQDVAVLVEVDAIKFPSIDEGFGGTVAKEEELVLKAKLFTLLMGLLSGFFGGLCGIRGPPLLFYFLHCPIKLSKAAQKATAAPIVLVNVVMRALFYTIKASTNNGDHSFDSDDWQLYIMIIFSSVGGIACGQKLFESLKDQQALIKTLLSILLFLSGVSLLVSSFVELYPDDESLPGYNLTNAN